jgi:hypothetical protein
MREFIVEKDSFGANPGLKDLSKHIYARMTCGPIIIVATNPQTTLPALRKQWFKLARRGQLLKSCTLNAFRILALTEQIGRMHNLVFSTNWSAYEYGKADVYLVTIEQLLSWAPECKTLYITYPVSAEHLHCLTTYMEKGAVVTECILSCQNRDL